MSQPESLTAQQVTHVAKLARLELTPAQVETYRAQLGAVLGHISLLSKVDIAGVEPMAHPFDAANRFASDDPQPSLSVQDVLLNAPVTEGRYLAVPKVLAEEA